MKKSLKRWHLLGAVMALSMAFAMPAFAEPAETVKVTVPNVKGGILRVTYYTENGNTVLIPLDETVSVPKDSELQIRTKDIYYYPTGGKRVDTSLKSLTVNGEELEETRPDTYSVTADEDMELSAVFAGVEKNVKENSDENYEVYFQSTEDSMTGVRKEENWSDKLYIEDLDTGKKIDIRNAVLEIFSVGYDYTDADGYPQWDELSTDFFQIGKDGTITCPGGLEKGIYMIDGIFQYQNEEYDFFLDIKVGASADVQLTYGLYRIGENRWGLCSSMVEIPVSDPDNTTIQAVVDDYLASDEKIEVANHPVSGWGSLRPSTNSFTRYNLNDKVSKYLEDYDINMYIDMIPQNYKVPVIQWLDAADVVPEDQKPGWTQKENGKWYYWTEYKEWAVSQWKDRGGFPCWLGADGAMVTNGIAGTGDDRWWVDKDGKKSNRSDTAVIDGMEYTFENGKVVSVKLFVKTPSNATEVKDLADSLLDNIDSLSDEEKVEAADKLMNGIKKLTPSSMEEKEVLKYDEIFKTVFGGSVNLSSNQDAVMGEGAPDDSDMQLGGYVLKGAYVASGITSEMIEEAGGSIDIEYRVEQIATASNANQAVRFNVKLLVNGKEVNSLAAPVYLELEMPETFIASYSNATYNYKGSFEKNGSKKTFTPVFQNSGEKLVLTIQDTGMYAIVVTKKSGSSGGGRSGARGSKGTYTTAVNKPGAWVQNQTGWWYHFTDGTWPANQWMSLSLQGTDYWFFFNADGYMVTGWQLFENNWYYLSPVSDGTKGHMLTGWQLIDGKWYYLNTVSGPAYGAMLKDTVTPDGYTVGSDGVLIE